MPLGKAWGEDKGRVPGVRQRTQARFTTLAPSNSSLPTKGSYLPAPSPYQGEGWGGVKTHKQLTKSPPLNFCDSPSDLPPLAF